MSQDMLFVQPLVRPSAVWGQNVFQFLDFSSRLLVGAKYLLNCELHEGQTSLPLSKSKCLPRHQARRFHLGARLRLQREAALFY